MIKSELLQLIDSLDFPKSDYYVLGGGCLIVREIREQTKDLDLCISKKLFDNIREKYNLNDFCRNEKSFLDYLLWLKLLLREHILLNLILWTGI